MVLGYCTPVLSLLPVLTVVPAFLVGVSVHFLRAQIRLCDDAGKWRLPDLAAVALIAACFLPPLAATIVIVLTTCALVLALALQLDGESSLWTMSPLVFVGDISFSLLTLTHTLAQKLLNRVLPSQHFIDTSVVLRVGVGLTYASTVASLVFGCVLFSRTSVSELGARSAFEPPASRADLKAPRLFRPRMAVFDVRQPGRRQRKQRVKALAPSTARYDLCFITQDGGASDDQ